MPILPVGNDRLRAAVNTHGAELWSVQTGNGAEWLWQGDATWWSGRAPILFPIVGRTFNNAISVDGKRYPMGIHGFCRQADFSVVEAQKDSVRLRLSDSPATREQYPFAFRLDLVFAVEGDSVVNRAEVHNPGSKPMPFSFGFHPAFKWPVPGGGGEQHWLMLDEPEEPPTTRLGKDLMTAPETEPSLFRAGRYPPQPADFERDALILDGMRSRAISFGVDGSPRIDVTFADLPTLGLWQKPGAPYICIEPWHGATPYVGGSDDIAQRPGNVWLEPGATRSFTMTLIPHPAG